LGVAIAGIVVVLPHGPRGVPPELVPASWQQYRTSLGHSAHLKQDNVACKDCHDFERQGFKSPGSGVCARCHERASRQAHPDAAGQKLDCLRCHTFAPDHKDATCMDCHATVQGTRAEIHEHGSTDCSDCHTMHAERFTSEKACAPCHDVRASHHAEHAGSKGCNDCHAPHTPGVAAVGTCSECHARPAGPRPAGHEACVACHKAHEFVAGGAAACTGCHGAKPALLADVVKEHQSCTSCHEPHAPGNATESCRRCHADVHPSHGRRDDCTSCHIPHSGDSVAKASPCTGCHDKVALVDTAAHRGGVACEDCHRPHDFRPPQKPGLCGQCHASETSLASTNRGHRDCAACHGTSAHQPVAAPGCGTCHVKEQGSAPVGHQNCRACHDAHAGQPLPQATCASCHVEKSHGPHGNIQGGCEICHRPHGPGGVASPPACTTCHARAELPALHADPAHAACASCHSSHEPPRADRASCTANCHQDRRDHQPQAATCTGCHVFRK
jgi:hypothetical protein